MAAARAATTLSIRRCNSWGASAAVNVQMGDCSWMSQNLIIRSQQSNDTSLSCEQAFSILSMHVFLAKWPNVRSCAALFLPRACMRSKGLCDRSWRLYIYIYIYCIQVCTFFGTDLLSPKILTFGGLF